MPTTASRAIVLGASMAGLAHAAVLADRFDRVILVDRDVLPDDAQQRRGVPQGEHIHLLVPGGVTRLEQLLPGVLADLTARGGDVIEASRWSFNMGGGRLALGDSDLRITGATRPLLEAVVRDRVLARDSIELEDGWTARELATTGDHSRVTGVRLRSEDDPDVVRTLDADLVVDATGRGSATPRWLEELGHTPPEEQRLQVGVHYTTRLFHRAPGDLGGCGNVLVDIPPHSRRGGVALAVEDDRWVISLIGMLGERPPTDLDGFEDYAASLWVDDLHTIVAGSTPVGDAAKRAFPSFSWRRYDQLDRLPEGLVVAGDAVCSLDPRFGQGMTVALAEAIALGEVLDEHGLDQVGTRTLAAAQPIVEDAWTLAAGADLANPEVEGPRPLPWKLTNGYLQRLLPVAHHDSDIAEAFVRVIALVDRPQALFHPGMVWRVLTSGNGAPTAPAETSAGAETRVGAES